MFHNQSSKLRATFIRKSKLFGWMWLVQSLFERVDVIGRLTVRHRGNPTQFSHVNWCEKFQALNLVWNFSYMKFFIHEIGVNFLSGMFNLVPHVKFLICIHFKHVSGVNQVWNRPDLMRIFCTGVYSILLCFNLILSTPKILSLCLDRLIVSMLNPQLQNPIFIDTKTLLSYGGSGWILN